MFTTIMEYTYLYKYDIWKLKEPNQVKVCCIHLFANKGSKLITHMEYYYSHATASVCTCLCVCV